MLRNARLCTLVKIRSEKDGNRQELRDTEIEKDFWVIVTTDGKCSAQVESKLLGFLM